MGNLHNVLTFDGGGTVGVGWIAVQKAAFQSREAMILPNVVEWDTWELEGTRHDQIRQAVEITRRILYSEEPRTFLDVVAEDFEFMQTLGGNDLLLPVEFNAVLAWELERNFNLRLAKQKRSLRTNITADRLLRMGFDPKLSRRWSKEGKGKDSFAAMQHAVAWLRRQKEQSKRRPWK